MVPFTEPGWATLSSPLLEVDPFVCWFSLCPRYTPIPESGEVRGPLASGHLCNTHLCFKTPLLIVGAAGRDNSTADHGRAICCAVCVSDADGEASGSDFSAWAADMQPLDYLT